MKLNVIFSVGFKYLIKQLIINSLLCTLLVSRTNLSSKILRGYLEDSVSPDGLIHVRSEAVLETLE